MNWCAWKQQVFFLIFWSKNDNHKWNTTRNVFTIDQKIKHSRCKKKLFCLIFFNTLSSHLVKKLFFTFYIPQSGSQFLNLLNAFLHRSSCFGGPFWISGIADRIQVIKNVDTRRRQEREDTKKANKSHKSSLKEKKMPLTFVGCGQIISNYIE